jgi:ATP-dependent Zn protease
LETSAVSDTERPDVTAKALLREEGKERQEELKALELKGETRENSVLWSSYNYVQLIYLF